MRLPNHLTFLFVIFLGYLQSSEIDIGHAKLSLIKDHSSFIPGTSINMGLKIEMDEGWHTYWKNPGDSGGPIEITWDLPDGFSASDIQWPTPERIPYPPLMTYGYEDFVIFPFVLSIPENYEEDSFTLNVDLLVCADVCIPESGNIVDNLENTQSDDDIYLWLQKIPKEVIDTYAYLENQSLFIDITFDQIIKDIYFFPDKGSFLNFPDKNEFNNDLNKITIRTFLNDPLQQNIQGVLKINDIGYLVDTTIETEIISSSSLEITFLIALIFAFIGGLILNLMPCVFPVISLKVLSFVSMGGDSNAKIRKHAYAFSAGVLFTFLTFAVSIILLKQAGYLIGWGYQLQSPAVVGFLSLLMVFLALVLITENSIGDSLTKLGSIQSNNDSYLSSLFTGVLAVVVASPCTAPFMGAALGYAFLQPANETIPVFISLSAGFSFPYVLLAIFPDLIAKLPKPGQWMKSLKEFFAFPMLATAIWLLWVFALQTSVNTTLILLIGWLLLGLNFWSFLNLQNKLIKIFIFITSMIGITLPSLSISDSANEMGQNLIPDSNQPNQNYTSWYPGIENDLQENNTAYFINFTAAWCITCQTNEMTAFSKKSFKDYIVENGITYVKADWTNRNDQISGALLSYKRSGVPLYVYWKPGLEEPQILPEILNDTILLGAIK